MKHLTAELRKILTRRFFGIMLIALAANFLLFWHNNPGGSWYYDQKTYLTAHQKLMAMEESQRLAYVEEQNRMLKACWEWESYDRLVQEDAVNAAITDEMLKYQEVYESGEYLLYTSSLDGERELFRGFLEELRRIHSHREDLEALIEEARMKTSVSIFAEPGSFAFRSQKAMVERFEQLLYIQPRYDVSGGVLDSQDSPATDLLCLMLILYFCVEMVVTEHKNGMLPILRATRKGRFPLIASKAAAAFILTLFVTLALWGTNLVYCIATTGLGDLSRPVQSLTGFSACTLEVTVGEYIQLFFLSKWLLYAAVGIVCLNVGLVSQSAMGTWLTMGGFLSAGYILDQVIPSISAWNVLKYVNISNLIFTTDWLSEYRTLNFFGYPAEAFKVSCVLLVTMLVLGTGCLCWLFCSRRTRVLPKVKARLRWPGWLPRPGSTTVLFGHEMWKLLIECGTIAVLVLFVLLSLQEPRTVSYATADLYYKNYMEILAGPMDADKEAFLEKEEQRFAGLRSQITQLNRDCADGKISSTDLEMLSQPLERALEAEKILKEQVYPLIGNVGKMAAQGKEAWLVYEPGYEYLFGLDPDHEKAGAAAMVVAGIILCFANYYPLETAAGMQPLLNVYARGRNSTAWSKLSVAMLLTTLMFLIAQMPDYWYVIRNYGFPVLSAPLCSLAAFRGWWDGISILGGIVIFEGLRLLSALSLAMIVMLICQWTRNQLTALCISTGVLLLPLLLHLLELDFLDAVSFYRPLTGTELLSGQNPLPLSLLYYGITLALGGICIWQIIRYHHRGSRRRKPRRA